MKGKIPPINNEAALETTVGILRGLLALMVLLAHALESARRAIPHAESSALLRVTLEQGAFWMVGFFVLSGFCIHRSILSQRKREGGLGHSYVLARVTRIYPLFLVALVGALLLEGWPGEGRAISHLFMMQGITGVIPAMKPAWSLTYEILYYAIWPLALLGCRWSSKRAFLFTGVGSIIVTGALFVCWKLYQGGDPASPLLVLALIAGSFPHWLAGAWLAQHWQTLQRHARAWMLPCGVLVLLFSYAAQAWFLHREARTVTLFAVGYASLPGWLLLLLGGSQQTGIVRWRSQALWLGLLSYPLYITHQVVLDASVAWMRSIGGWESIGAAAVVLGGIVLLVMIVVGVPLERFSLKKRAQFLHHLRHKPAPAVPAS